MFIITSNRHRHSNRTIMALLSHRHNNNNNNSDSHNRCGASPLNNTPMPISSHNSRCMDSSTSSHYRHNNQAFKLELHRKYHLRLQADGPCRCRDMLRRHSPYARHRPIDNSRKST